jgi:S1-C subfamily serine protease
MKLSKFAWIAALWPAVAFAGPNGTNDQRQQQNETDIESETFEWSSGQGQLGVMVMSLTPELRNYFGAPKGTGLLVAHVEPGSAAARAGIRAGDVITKVGNKDVRSAADVIDALPRRNQQRAAWITIEVVRNHATRDLQVAPAPSGNTPGNDTSQRT